MSTSIRFILNPRSGVKGKQPLAKLIAERMPHADVRMTEHAGHATTLAHEAAITGATTIVAVGGDGSVNEVASGLLGSDAVLGILPAGSGNGLAMHLGWGRDAVAALDRLPTATVRTLDTATLDGRPFVNLAGVGLDGRIAYRMKRVRRRGLAAYVYAGFLCFWELKSKKYCVWVDGELVLDGVKALSVTVANAPMYGYNCQIAPQAVPDDGVLDVVVLRYRLWWHYLTELPRMFNGTFHKSRVVSVFKGKNIRIECARLEYAHCDGEGLAAAQAWTFVVVPQSLRVLVPLAK